MGKILEERKRINHIIATEGMRDAVRTVMEEKGVDCPSAKHYIHKIQERKWYE